MKKRKVYWHRLSNKQQIAALNSKIMVKTFVNRYSQPTWCMYGGAMHGVMGCWSLVLNHSVHSKKDCGKCEFVRKGKR